MSGKTTLILRIRSMLQTWLDRAQHYRSKSQSGLLTWDDVEKIFDEHLIPLRQEFDIATSVAGIAAHAAHEWNYPQADLVADFTALRAALQSTGDWLQGVSGANAWRGYSRDATTWNRNLGTFSTGETSGFRAELDDDIATINTFLGKIAADL